MIRTEAIPLTALHGLAYKQKLTAGGAGVTIITADDRAVFTINKRDGACVPFGTVNAQVFTPKVVNEALELTRGLSYKRMGSIVKVYPDQRMEESPVETETTDDQISVDVIASVEYREFIAQYTDKNDKFSYQLMNKDLMQFAARSSVVGRMLADKADPEEIVGYIVLTKAANLSHKSKMDEGMLTAFIETFDSMDTRSAFKELRAYLRGKMSRGKSKK